MTISFEGLMAALVIGVVIAGVSYLCGRFATLVGQPVIVGRILGGLMLGPSVFGKFFPTASQLLFHPSHIGFLGLDSAVDHEANHILKHAAEYLGLCPFLLMVGMEFAFSHLKESRKSTMAISVIGILLPFTLGASVAPWIMEVTNTEVDLHLFAFFVGIGMSITALPVLGGMMVEWKITKTRLATIVISCATCDDACGWVLLAAGIAAATVGWQWQESAFMVAEIAAYIAVMLVVVRPFMKRAIARIMEEGSFKSKGIPMLVVATAASAAATEFIGIFAIFGAFFLGAILSSEKEFCEKVKETFSPAVNAFFIPIFFTATGLRTNVDVLEGWGMWTACGVVAALAIIGKMGGCGFVAWWFGFSKKEAALVGILMNTRALMELIVINKAHECGVFPPEMFCIMVAMAVITTAMTTPLVRMFRKGTELENMHIGKEVAQSSRCSSVVVPA